MTDQPQAKAGLTDAPTDPAAHVVDRDGDVWARHERRWGCLTTASAPQAWHDLVNVCGPLRLAARAAQPDAGTLRGAVERIAEALYLRVMDATADQWTEWRYLTEFTRQPYVAEAEAIAREITALLAEHAPEPSAAEALTPDERVAVEAAAWVARTERRMAETFDEIERQIGQASATTDSIWKAQGYEGAARIVRTIRAALAPAPGEGDGGGDRG